jgi:hypothetical protein
MGSIALRPVTHLPSLRDGCVNRLRDPQFFLLFKLRGLDSYPGGTLSLDAHFTFLI